MKNTTLTFVLVLYSTLIFSQEKKYAANWESLDSRPVPEWFSDAKFGIFIHWGPYSVPAWSPKGTYSEWYQYWLQEKTLFGNGEFSGKEVYDYHTKTYGKDFPYYNFGDMFKADLFEPADWAGLFEKAGARYVVLTTKHHDGYCLWPSKEANDRGFTWNSMDIGPHRDLVGELTRAVKKKGLKMGFYYSLYEWYHPWWINDRDRFVNEHFHPQFRDLVIRYEPDIMWGDGEWEMPAETWKTAELMAWLYNESPVKDKVVINDRWGKGIRKQHGGYFTTEYDADAPEFERPWEECRGMGFSFGYNRNEDAWDYNSPKTLILMLVNIVSSGGNLLLDIGPDDRGQIPPIMEERLLAMGKWLDINGEAIFGTGPWKIPFQWSAGDRDYNLEEHYTPGDYILKQTVDPEPGYAVKEVFFTYKDHSLYTITPKWPGDALTIRGLNAGDDSEVTLLATGQKLEWKNEGGDLIVTLPVYDPQTMGKSSDAYAYKITGIKK